MTANSTEEEPTGKMLLCSQCPKEFRYNSERIRHEKSHSPGFQCEVCSKKFSFVSALRRHQKQHERTGSVMCDLCNRKFRDEVLLKRHIKYAHKGTFACSKCCSQFSSDQALRSHMKTHKPESERMFKCSFHGCVKSFNFSHHLKHHELTHTNAKQHHCSVCGKGFIQSHHLKTHVKTHDPAEWLYCEFSGCKKRFYTEYARNRHMITHKFKPDSGISSDSSSSETFVSSKCVKGSSLNKLYKKVTKQQENEKHSAKCGNTLDNSSTDVNSCTTDDLKRDFENALSLDSWKANDVKSENLFDPPESIINSHTTNSCHQENVLLKVKHSTPIFDKDIGECKTSPGGCIMGPDNCVCVDISNSIAESYDFTPIENPNGAVTFENDNRLEFDQEKIYSDLKSFEYNNNEVRLSRNTNNGSVVQVQNLGQNNVNNSICKGCDCVSSCNVEPTNCSYKPNNILPNIEYRVGGVIKIKDTFDVDIPIKTDFKAKDNSAFIPFSTCRDVIGNCIAGGSEGCLCARMMMDDQQAMAQEIDDITPKPKTDN